MDSRHLHRLHNRLSTLMSSKDRPPVNPSPRVQRLRPPLRCSPSPRVATLLPALWYSSRYQIFPVRWTWTRWRRRTFIHCSWPAGCSFNARGGCFTLLSTPLVTPSVVSAASGGEEGDYLNWIYSRSTKTLSSVQAVTKSWRFAFWENPQIGQKRSAAESAHVCIVIKVNTKKCAALG